MLSIIAWAMFVSSTVWTVCLGWGFIMTFDPKNTVKGGWNDRENWIWIWIPLIVWVVTGLYLFGLT